MSDSMETTPMADGEYFKSYENFEVHKLMLQDKARTEAYRNAILENKNLFKDKIVMDVGAGTGILSMFCAEAGAKKVYAIEASELALITKDIVKENNFEEVIEVVHRKVEELNLDIKVDIIVSEWMGFYLIHESMLDSVIYARDKFLKDQHSLMFPNEAILKCAPCSLDNLLNYWDNVYDYKMSSIKKAVRQSLLLKPEIMMLNCNNLLSEAKDVLNLDLMKIKTEELEYVKKQIFLSTNRDGLYQGVALWFDVTFPQHSKVFSTSPLAVETHWKQTILVWPQDQTVEDGDVLSFEITFKRSGANERQYTIQMEELGEDVPHPTPCSCGLPTCNIIKAFLSNNADGDDDLDDYEIEVFSENEDNN